VASCTGTGVLEIVSFPAQDSRHVKVVLTAGGTGNWWSVDELNLYADATGTVSTEPISIYTTTAVPAPTALYNVVDHASDSCVDATGWGTVNGTALQQWSCGLPAQANQEWQSDPTDSGYYDVLNRNAASADEVWDVTGGPEATSSGIPLQLWSYVGGNNQAMGARRDG
jgi:glucosylceramidase